jgi:hypothetical protein
MRRTPSAAGFQRGQRNRPRRMTAGTWKPTCSRPLTNTPMARVTPGLAVCGAMPIATTIMTMFMITWVYAGSANLP